MENKYQKEQFYLPFSITPRFSRRLGRAAETMSFADAVTETLADSGIKVEVEGDLPLDSGGLLIAGDHSQRIEPLLAQSLVGAVGRESTHVIARPDSAAGRLIQSSGSTGQELIIPVLQANNSNQYRPSPLSEPRAFYRKHHFPNAFNQPVEILHQLNNDALDTAAQKVASGEAVTIFPSGGPGTAEWRGGFGQIASRLSPEARAATEVSLFRPAPFSVKRVAGALALRELGIRPRTQTLVLQNANIGKVADILEDTDPDTYARDFTRLVRELYLKQYGSQ